MIEKRPRVAEATKYKPSADSASNAVVDTTWSSLGKYVETTACWTYTKPPNIKHPNAPKMEMKRTRKRFASAGVCVCMAMIESDNGSDHRAGTRDHPLQKHAQARLRVHHIVIQLIRFAPDNTSCCVNDIIIMQNKLCVVSKFRTSCSISFVQKVCSPAGHHYVMYARFIQLYKFIG